MRPGEKSTGDYVQMVFNQDPTPIKGIKPYNKSLGLHNKKTLQFAEPFLPMLF